jgi:hypothetical protein
MKKFYQFKILVLIFVLFGLNKIQAQEITLTATGGNPDGSFSNLNEAFAAINAGTHTGEIEIFINNNTSEPTTPIPLLASGQSSADYTSIIIKPTDNVTVSAATVTGRAVIELDGADNITIDGSIDINGTTRNLTIENNAAATVTNTAAIRLIGRTTLGLGAENITIKNCIILGATSGNYGTGSGNTNTTSFGIYAGTNTASLSTNSLGDNYDNLSIENNEVRRAYRGIYIGGTTTNVADNLVIKDNIISSSNQSEQTSFRGVEVRNINGGLIENNQIASMKINSATSNAAISIEGTTSSIQNIRISKNKISGIYSESTSGYGAYGVNIASGNNITIDNNIIYDVKTANYNSSSTTFQAFGIRLGAGTGHKVYYNSVHLYGNITIGGSTTNALSACLVVTGTAVTNLDIRNNIFSNKMTSTASTPYFYALWFPASYNFSNAFLNNNAYFVSATTRHFVGKIGGTFGSGDYQTLANWQAISQVNNAGNDANSMPSTNGDAPFTSDIDLTIPNATVTLMESGGALIPSPFDNIDFTGATRPVSPGIAPDMGAIEFDGVNPNLCSGTPDASITVLNTNIACFGQNIIASLSPAYTSPGISYQWQSSTDIAGPYTDIVGEVSSSYTSQATNSFFYKCIVTCVVSGLSVESTPVEFTINNAVYASIPLTESFEDVWQTTCVTAPLGQDAPNNSWRTTPVSGNTSWRANNTTTALSGWTSVLGSYSPTASNGLHSARFHSYNASNGSQGSLDLYVDLSVVGAKQLTFDFINTSGTDVLHVFLSEDGGQTFNPVTTLPATLGVAASWTSVTASIVSVSPTSVIRFRGTSDFGATDIGLDNVSILIPCSGTPTAGTVSANNTNVCLGGSSNLSLSSNTIGIGITYQWQSASAVSGPFNDIVGATSESYSATNLTSNTFFKCVVTCDFSGDSDETTPAEISINNAVYASIPLTESFEDVWQTTCVTAPLGQDVPNNSWRTTPVSGNTSWRANNTTTVLSGWSSVSGAYSPAASNGLRSARFHSFNASNGSQGSLDLYVDLSAAGTKQLTFDFINTSGTDILEVFLSEDGGQTFNPVTTLPATLGVAASWTSVTASIVSVSPTSVIRFRGTSDFGATDIGLDNVSILIPCSGTPTAGTVSANNTNVCLGGSSNLSLSGNTIGIGITYQWQSASAVSGPFTDIIGATSESYSATNLTSTTFFKCVVTCDFSGDSDETTPVELTVASPISTFPFVENFNSTAVGSIPECWTRNLISGTNNWNIGTTTNASEITSNFDGNFAYKLWNASETHFISPAINLSSAGANNATLDFQMHRRSPAHATDKINFYINTQPNLTGALLLQSYPSLRTATAVATAYADEVLSVASNGWYNYTMNIPTLYNTEPIVYIIAQGVTAGGSSSYGIAFDDFRVQIPFIDCNGDLNGTAFIDSCGTCVAGNTALSPCVAWVGTFDTVWENQNNWSNLLVPQVNDDVVILETNNDPVISSLVQINGVNVNSGAELVVSSGNSLTVNGVLTNNGTITLKTGATLVQTSGSTTAGSGIYNVEQFLKGSGGVTPNGRFYYLGTPLTGATTSVFDAANNNRFWTHTEVTGLYTRIQDNATSLTAGGGYTIRMGADDTVVYSSNTLNNGNYTFAGLSNTQARPKAERGIHLWSNPYPSHIDWDLINRTNIDLTYQLRTQNTSTNAMVFDTYNANSGVGTNNNGNGALNKYVAPFQAIWLRVNANIDEGTLALNNSMRSHQNGNVLKSNSDQEIIRLHLSNGSVYDETVIYMHPNANNDLDAFDSQKMMDEHHQLFSVEAGSKLVLNGIENASVKESVQLGIKIDYSGNYSINANELNTMENVVLEDKKENKLQDLKANPRYVFTTTQGEDLNRFVLHFNKKVDQATSNQLAQNMNDEVRIFAFNGNQVKVIIDDKAYENANINVYNMLGALVSSQRAESRENILSLNVAAGIYMVELVSKEKVTTQKVMIK